MGWRVLTDLSREDAKMASENHGIAPATLKNER
jgi:hypothetical protein